MMTADDLRSLSAAPPGERIAYGDEPLQYAELILPAGPGPHPVVANIHGGVWMAQYTIEHSRAQARALAASGFAVWNIEYRRVGDAGGGWPGTFRDVSNAVDHLRQVAKSHPLDLSRVCIMGHSAGGQLALWATARNRVPSDSELHVRKPLAVRGVVALAPATQLEELYVRGLYDGIAGKLIGGSPAQFPERYAAVTPARLLPLNQPQVIILGKHDESWNWHTHAYYAAAREACEPDLQLIVIESAGHFELIAPESPAWATVTAAAHALVR